MASSSSGGVATSQLGSASSGSQPPQQHGAAGNTNGGSGVNKIDPEKRFTKQEKIGRGSFGEVFKGIDKQDNSVVAIKIIDLEEAEDEIEDIQQEIQVLSQCDSTFVTKYYGSFLKVRNSNKKKRLSSPVSTNIIFFCLQRVPNCGL